MMKYSFGSGAVVMAAMLKFSVECRDIRPGQAVFIVGSVPELGKWQIPSGLQCTTTPETFPQWTSVEVLMDTTETIELEIVIADEIDAANPWWEEGWNKTMQPPAGGGTSQGDGADGPDQRQPRPGHCAGPRPQLLAETWWKDPSHAPITHRLSLPDARLRKFRIMVLGDQDETGC